MPKPVEFWFDFSSPYAYFAACEIEARLKPYGRPVAWKPFLLGAVFRLTGMGPLAETPLRGDYARRDWQRLARILDVPFRLPERHPYRSQASARAFYWFLDRQPQSAVPFARRALEAHFVHQRDLGPVETVLQVAGDLCSDPDHLANWLRSEVAKQRLKAVTDEAVSKGVFGSPFFIADGEPVWGWDRIPLLEQWLLKGSWERGSPAPPSTPP